MKNLLCWQPWQQIQRSCIALVFIIVAGNKCMTTRLVVAFLQQTVAVYFREDYPKNRVWRRMKTSYFLRLAYTYSFRCHSLQWSWSVVWWTAAAAATTTGWTPIASWSSLGFLDTMLADGSTEYLSCHSSNYGCSQRAKGVMRYCDEGSRHCTSLHLSYQ